MGYSWWVLFIMGAIHHGRHPSWAPSIMSSIRKFVSIIGVIHDGRHCQGHYLRLTDRQGAHEMYYSFTSRLKQRSTAHHALEYVGILFTHFTCIHSANLKNSATPLYSLGTRMSC
ncbi:uncharacterized protein LY89DRAFT_469595 [Mollisia scopiformis]|uniref:Uncharacterized protein n=1 Tax=Mollisia scopiformis TaxID=149040 RepID=A0A194XIT2_MOLSC|nr:uncharacterized protein LY89DRAFT_469595 [Mollisia scopiformis]KUJ20041.1 hypothetical protein LY89DRAFT_469595 [Mollisia scopiformis]